MASSVRLRPCLLNVSEPSFLPKAIVCASRKCLTPSASPSPPLPHYPCSCSQDSLWQSRRRMCSPVRCAVEAGEQEPGVPLVTEARHYVSDPGTKAEYCVVNFYHLVEVNDPEKVVVDHRAWIASHNLDIRGRIYYSQQGVNAQFGGLKHEAMRYVDWLLSQPLWQGLRFSVWPCEGHAFPKLRLKYKPNLISLAGGIQNLPVTNQEARATPLQPRQWKEMIAEAEKKNMVVLDVRNDYEWDAGHFSGAVRPDEEEFAETPVPGVSEEEVPGPLKGADPETPVMMYCTGGIRCDIYSTLLKSKGFKNLYTLEGGIQSYLREEGSDHWKGSLYVFDARMAISAEGARTTASSAADSSSGTLAASASRGQPLPAAVPCQVCQQAAAELPHVNCANIDCNELFIACPSCKQRFQGCCCQECMSAPRLLRPAKTAGGYYGAWGNYASEESLGPVMATGRAREGRVARRAKKREAMKVRRTRQAEQRVALKADMREAMARLEASKREEGKPSESTRAAELRKSLQLKGLLLANEKEGVAM